MARYVASPDVRMFQSRLLSPGYSGVGRWVLFDAASRRAFSAAGRDVIPDVVRVMTMASGGATTAQLAAAIPEATPGRLERLHRAGLLSRTGASRTGAEVEAGAGTFTDWYQRASFDYPFHDYSAPGWQQEERDLLDRYARLWPAPSSVLERPGPLWPLPRHELLDGPPDRQPGTLRVSVLAWVLQHAFAPIGEIRTRHVSCIRRTSPSGGARHPAEAGVELPVPVDGIPAGSYVYDVARHGLVRVAEHARTTGTCPVIVVQMRVARAMWRYRDLRALRPVLLDAGHIVETISLLLDRCGLSSTLSAPPPPPSDEFGWLKEPPVAALTIGDEPPRWAPSHQPDRPSPADFLTNPAGVLRFANGSLVGTTVWPETREVSLDENDFLVLNHCVPSSRGDRQTTHDGIVAAVPGTSADGITALVHAGLLLPRNTAEGFYRAAGLWVRHDWYLSLLAHLESLARPGTRPTISATPSDRHLDLRALAGRRTTRAFGPDELPGALIPRLLHNALETTGLPAAVPEIHVFVAPPAVAGLPARVHEWVGGDLKALDIDVTRALVRDLTTGQRPAGDAACAIWLVARLPTDDPAGHELGLIELGRTGQRICLAAAEADIGVFITPAVRDRTMLAYLGIDPDPAMVVYAFSLGNQRRA